MYPKHLADINSDLRIGFSFEIPDGGLAFGIFLNSSRFNHACHPYSTCTYQWDKHQDRLVVTTLMDVAEGEELTISYIGWSNNTSRLYENYGFWCDCQGCPSAKEAQAKADMLAGKHYSAPQLLCHQVCV